MNTLFNINRKLLFCLVLLTGMAVLPARQLFMVSAAGDNRESSQQNGSKIKDLKDSPVFAEFAGWIKQNNGSSPDAESRQAKVGENLAVKRRELLKQLIEVDPQAAFEKAIPFETYNLLPSFIKEHVEKPISGYGDLMVYVFDDVDPSTGKMVGARTERTVVFGNEKYKAYVYGRRESMTTKLNIPLQGFVIDGVMAVDEIPVRKIEPAEYAARTVDSSKLSENGIAAEVGGEIRYFSNPAQLNDFVSEEAEWESKIGPKRSEEGLAPNESASVWTEGVKKVLVIRVDFPDKPGEPVDVSNQPLTVARAQNLFTNDVNPFYLSNSYNKTSFQVTVTTTVVRLPQPQTFYGQDITNANADTMMTDARNAARAAGFETNNFDLDIVAFSRINSLTFAGLGVLGGKGTWLNGYFSLRETAHELGHNYGLNHANLWRTTDGSVIGAGANSEYGDPFDMMGNNSFGRPLYFNAQYKRLLDWLTDANVQTVTTDGVYRIFQEDDASANGIRTLKIRKNSTKNYWVEFRQLITNNPSALNGAMIRWDYASKNFRETQLLDMTPNTSTNADDAPLLVGQSFLDNENHIKITIVGKGNTTPESLDIKVELNLGCSFSLAQATQSFAPNGGEGNLTVNTASGCSPAATSNNSWLSVVSADSGTVKYIVGANTTSQPRTGTINISGQIFTVQQAAAATACITPPSGLIAWWRGEGSGLDQTGVNNGSVSATMTYSAGKVGGGFNGTGAGGAKILVPDSSSLALDHSLSIEGWLRFDTITDYAVMVRGDDRDYKGAYGIFLFNGRLWFRILDAPNGTTVSVISPGVLAANQFVHFAATLDDATGQMKLYINGALAAQTVTTIRPYRDILAAQNGRIGIGNLAHSSLAYGSFNGIIDELAVYNRALSISEVQSIYNAGTAQTGTAGKCVPADATVQAVVGTTPAGLSFTVDGTTYTSTQTFNWQPGSNHTIATASPQNISNTRYVWNGWSDSGAMMHTIAPSSNTSYTANFTARGTNNRKTAGVFRPSNGITYMRNSNTGGVADISMIYGVAGDQSFAGDWNGDGVDSIGIYRNGVFYLRNSNTTGPADVVFAFGSPGDQPIAGDWNGDGIDTIGVYRPTTGVFMLRNSNSAGAPDVTFVLGNPGDVAIAGDWNGDGITTTGVFRPTNGIVYLKNTNVSGDADIYLVYGVAGDKPLAGDWDGDGIDSIGIYRGGVFYLRNSNTQGVADLVFALGNPGDEPIAGDWDGQP